MNLEKLWTWIEERGEKSEEDFFGGPLVSFWLVFLRFNKTICEQKNRFLFWTKKFSEPSNSILYLFLYSFIRLNFQLEHILHFVSASFPPHKTYYAINLLNKIYFGMKKTFPTDRILISHYIKTWCPPKINNNNISQD